MIIKNSLIVINKALSEANRLRLAVALLGLCISLFTLFTAELINRDGVLYLQTAHVFNEAGFDASFNQYRWPFYSIAIAFCHSVTTLTLEHSAHLLHVIFLLVLVDAFVRLYWELNSKVKYLWMPAVIILAYTGLNDYRPMVIRDWGYWAFLFQALLYYVKADKHEKLGAYVLWQVFIILAFLFRVEAFVFMLVLPFLCLMKKRSIASFFYSGFVFLLPFSIMFFLIMSGSKGGRVSEILVYMDVVSYWDNFIKYAYNVAKHALRHHAESHAVLFAISGLLGVLIVKTVGKLGILYIGIALIGQVRYKVLKNFQCSFINVMIGLSFIIVFIFFLRSKVIAGRYTIQITLFLLLYITYYSEFIFDKIKSLEKPWLVGLIGCVFFINLMIGIQHSNSNKGYIKTMGEWIKHNIAYSDRVTTNDTRLYYYSGGVLKNNMVENFSLKNNDYALLKIKEDDRRYDTLINKGKLELIHSIVGQSGDSAVLFKIKNP